MFNLVQVLLIAMPVLKGLGMTAMKLVYFIGANFKHTGEPTLIVSPVGVNRPVAPLRLKTTISSLPPLPTNRKLPVGSIAKFLGPLPKVDWRPT